MMYDLRVTARWVNGLLIASMVAEVAYLLHTLWFLNFLNALAGGRIDEFAAEERGAQIDALGGLVGLGYLAIFIACVIASGMWIYRASHNAGRLAPVQGRTTPGWAVGWFFVPVANLWKPYQAMRQTWNSTFRPSGDIDQAGPPRLRWWWGTWIVSNILANISFRLSMRADDIETFTVAAFADVIGAPITIASVVLFRNIVNSVTDGQSQDAEMAGVTHHTSIPGTGPRAAGDEKGL